MTVETFRIKYKSALINKKLAAETLNHARWKLLVLMVFSLDTCTSIMTHCTYTNTLTHTLTHTHALIIMLVGC